ncbi:hypothetical protein PVAND_010972 [Polypedilum vanderplanki]|uniref:Uncharacterized protein n=1 Tax=Polypedilum vanderplanki TaxID=319348 RepID=A0A9J6CI56_POLVA|nr:hypothetical protein PVAND_010972 [Polypedilum vanderplanki]
MLLLLFSFLFLSSFASADPNREKLLAIKEFAEEGNRMNIESSHTGMLKVPESTLKPLEKKVSRDKRQAENFNTQLLYDEVDDVDNNFSNAYVDRDVRSTVQKVKLPLNKGHSAFSITANTVYILYPSLFQDPNIFGRFAINQNLDSSKELKTSVDEEETSSDKEAIQNTVKLPYFESMKLPYARRVQPQPPQYIQQPSYRNIRPFRRSAVDFSVESDYHQPPYFDEQQQPPQEEAYDSRNVETHLNGEIVVLNQDVNEKNIKESY